MGTKLNPGNFDCYHNALPEMTNTPGETWDRECVICANKWEEVVNGPYCPACEDSRRLYMNSPETSKVRLSPEQRAALGVAESIAWWGHTSATRQFLVTRGLVEIILYQDLDGPRRRRTPMGTASL